MKKYDEIHVYLESGCFPNSEDAFAVMVIVSGQGLLIRTAGGVYFHSSKDIIGLQGLDEGLELAAERTSKKVIVYTDNDLLIKQMNGSHKVTGSDLISMYCEARKAEEEFEEVIYKNSIEGDDQWAYLAYKYRRQVTKDYPIKYFCGSSMRNEKTKNKKKDLEKMKS